MTPSTRHTPGRSSVVPYSRLCGDIDGDGEVGFGDLTMVLASWGQSSAWMTCCKSWATGALSLEPVHGAWLVWFHTSHILKMGGIPPALLTEVAYIGLRTWSTEV